MGGDSQVLQSDRSYWLDRRQKPTADDIKNTATKDLTRYGAHIEGKELLKNLGLTRRQIKTNACYEKAWGDYPEKAGKSESKYYSVLTDMFNSISSKKPRSAGIAEEDEGVPEDESKAVSWFDTHSLYPSASDGDNSIPKIRPDLLLLPKRVVEGLQSKEHAKKSSPQDDDDYGDVDPLMWCAIHVPVEVKAKKTTSEIFSATVQLTGYLSCVMKEQADRRHAIGLGICHDVFIVIYIDRSGILVSTPMPMKEDTFPQVIGQLKHFAECQPECLGWDPTMLLFRRDTPFEPIPSYLCPFDTERKDSISRYDVHWVIDAPAEHDKDAKSASNGRELFVTLKAITIVQMETICGRGRIVWEAVKLKDLPNPSQLYIIKQLYRSDYRSTQEGSLFLGTVLEETLHSFEDVAVQVTDRNFAYSTATVRNGLALKDIPQEVEWVYQEESREKTLYYTKNRSKDSPTEHACRVQNRLIQSVWGDPITFFNSVKELLAVILDCLNCHEDLYRNGVLHRDISEGNIIICPKTTGSGDVDFRDTRGQLIDLDNARKSDKRYSTTPPGFDERFTERLAEITRIHAETKLNCTVSDEHVSKILTSPAHMDGNLYLFHAVTAQNEYKLKTNATSVQNVKTEKGGPIASTEELGWNIPERLPNFEDYKPSPHPRSGTTTFMSAEVWRGNPVYFWGRNLSDSTFLHEPIHDIESLFWVTLNLCIFWRPGHERVERQEEELPDIVNTIYGDNVEESMVAKSSVVGRLYGGPELEKILALFEPYYEPLKPMLRYWRYILSIGYNYRSYEFVNIHAILRKLIKETIGRLPEEPESDTEELRRRNKQYHHLLDLFQNVQMPVSDGEEAEGTPTIRLRTELEVGPV